MNYFLKFILLLNFILLAWFTQLQFNDPDALIWIGIYGICALVPLLALFNRLYKPVFWLAILCCSLAALAEAKGAYTYFLHRHEEALMQSMNPAKPYIEEAREFLGGLIGLSLIVLSRLIIKWVQPQGGTSNR
jgi:Transmembrane family 220, helix